MALRHRPKRLPQLSAEASRDGSPGGLACNGADSRSDRGRGAAGGAAEARPRDRATCDPERDRGPDVRGVRRGLPHTRRHREKPAASRFLETTNTFVRGQTMNDLKAFLDGELDAAVAGAMQARIQSDGSLAAAAADFRLLASSFGALTAGPRVTGREKVMEAIRAPRVFVFPWKVATALASAVLLVTF